MESLQKFECWEELSDEELATISGGTGGNLGLSVTGPAGTTGTTLGPNGATVTSGGVGGNVTTGVGSDGVSVGASGNIVPNSVNATVG